MPPKSTKTPKPEDLLIRVIRVAEILAKGQSQSSQLSTTEAKSSDAGIDVDAIRVQKTQP